MWRGASLKTKALVMLGAVAAMLLLFVFFRLLMLAVLLGGLLLFALILGRNRRTTKSVSHRSPIAPRPPKSLLDYQKRTLDDMVKSQKEAFRATKNRFWGR